MDIFGIILIISFLIGVSIAIAVTADYFTERDQMKEAQEQVQIQAAIRAWNISKQEQATDHAIRMATHQAVEQMMQEARGGPGYGGK